MSAFQLRPASFSLSIVFLLLCRLPLSLQFITPIIHFSYSYNSSNIQRYKELEPFSAFDRIKGVMQALDTAGYGAFGRFLGNTVEIFDMFRRQLCKGRADYQPVTGITILAPSVIASGFRPGFLEYQILPILLREKDFNKWTVGTSLNNSCGMFSRSALHVTQLPYDDGAGTKRYAQINGANIVHWDIYSDEYIVVHGVDRYFSN